jgi:acyl-CoA thioester hydrolase
MTDHFNFRTPLKIRFNETDLQGHVNFGHYLFYFDVGLTEYLTAIGYEYQDMLDEGSDMLYVESHCNYESPAKWPEVLDIQTRVGHLGRRSMRFEFEVTSQKDQRVIATGHVVTVTVEQANWEPCEIPDRLRQAIETFEQHSLSPS